MPYLVRLVRELGGFGPRFRRTKSNTNDRPGFNRILATADAMDEWPIKKVPD